MTRRLQTMKDRLEDMKPKPFASNIPRELRQAIDELRRNKSITIREADKGSCIVLQNTSDYISEGYQHLADTTTYQELDHDRTEEVAHKANWALTHHQSLKTLSNNQEATLYTQPSGTRTQEMYFLRKVHKTPHKVRPIVSCSSGPTERISGFLCRVLSPHLDNVKSLITNSQQVVQIIESLDLSQHSSITLVSLDVEALYLSIPQAAAIEMVLQRVLPTSPPSSQSNNYKNMIRNFLKVVICDNTFRFHQKFFNQVKGVAMGTKCAPPFANLFLACLEEKALASWTGPNPLLWLRFLDDILMLWSGNQDQLQRFFTHLNQQMTHINFTMTQSQQFITFLDLEVYKGHRFRRASTLDTKLYIKPTNPQTFLHYTSCHPASTFATIVKGELLRALRATSDVETFSITVSKLLERFLQRGYPREFFLRVAETVTFGDRVHLLTSHPRRTLPSNTTIFSIRYHPALPSSDIWQALQDEETPFNPMVVRSKPTSHRDLLVRAKTAGRSDPTTMADQPSRSHHQPPDTGTTPPPT